VYLLLRLSIHWTLYLYKFDKCYKHVYYRTESALKFGWFFLFYAVRLSQFHVLPLVQILDIRRTFSNLIWGKCPRVKYLKPVGLLTEILYAPLPPPGPYTILCLVSCCSTVSFQGKIFDVSVTWCISVKFLIYGSCRNLIVEDDKAFLRPFSFWDSWCSFCTWFYCWCDLCIFFTSLSVCQYVSDLRYCSCDVSTCLVSLTTQLCCTAFILP
jgi:hypothetical protein